MRPRHIVWRAVVAAVTLSLVFPLSAAAWQGEGGTKYCSETIGYVHFRYNDIADVLPPGTGTLWLYRDNDSAWHTRERNGALGGGYWEAYGDPYLDLPNTWAACRPFG
jgi:hypothetical protein